MRQSTFTQLILRLSSQAALRRFLPAAIPWRNLSSSKHFSTSPRHWCLLRLHHQVRAACHCKIAISSRISAQSTFRFPKRPVPSVGTLITRNASTFYPTRKFASTLRTSCPPSSPLVCRPERLLGNLRECQLGSPLHSPAGSRPRDPLNHRVNRQDGRQGNPLANQQDSPLASQRGNRQADRLDNRLGSLVGNRRRIRPLLSLRQLKFMHPKLSMSMSRALMVRQSRPSSFRSSQHSRHSTRTSPASALACSPSTASRGLAEEYYVMVLRNWKTITRRTETYGRTQCRCALHQSRRKSRITSRLLPRLWASKTSPTLLDSLQR